MRTNTKGQALNRRTTRVLALRERDSTQRHSQEESSTLGAVKVGLGNTTKSTTHLGRGAITEMENTALTTQQEREITMENTTDSNHLTTKPDTQLRFTKLLRTIRDNSGE
jgi:hypothetical protein